MGSWGSFWDDGVEATGGWSKCRWPDQTIVLYKLYFQLPGVCNPVVLLVQPSLPLVSLPITLAPLFGSLVSVGNGGLSTRPIVSIQDESTIRPWTSASPERLPSPPLYHGYVLWFARWHRRVRRRWRGTMSASPSLNFFDYYGFTDSVEPMPLSVIAGQSSPHSKTEHLSIHLFETAVPHSQAFMPTPSIGWNSEGFPW